MILFGSITNALLIVLGAFIGRFLNNIPERMKETVMYGIGLAVTAIGVQMTFESTQILIVIISIVIGAVIGEWMDLEGKINQLGQWIEKKLPAKNEGPGIAQGFVTATLIFVVGSMAIIGAIDSGLRNDHDVLLMKGINDGFTSIILSSTLGIGVAFAAIPVLLYQGIITLCATQISRFVSDELLSFFISEMTATGGLMIVGIGLNLIGITKMRVANFIPGIVVVGVIVTIVHMLH
ncbi:putative membrane protein YqgA involved in biofilm formation [Sporosarcina luteola]|nr:putative membrane protein YqgA involved in biofilm formation [Sporosarcina luteola]